MLRNLLYTFVLLAGSLLAVPKAVAVAQEEKEQRSSPPRLHNKYAIIVSTSRYWFNYRHHTNALLIYQYMKNYGNYTDDHIILMLADEYNVNSRNPIKNHIYNTATDSVMKQHKNDQQRHHNHQRASNSLYTEDIEIDYRGEDVTVENFVYALTGGRQQQQQQQQQQQHPNQNIDNNDFIHHPHHRPVLYNTNQDSYILIYMTGHGGDLFFKFQDYNEITSNQLANTLQYMYIHNLYNKILIIIDTCQAFTLSDTIIARKDIPNIYIVGTSLRGESSYAHTGHPIIGISVVEKYTHYMMEYVTSKQQQSKHSSSSSSLTLSQVLIEPFNTSKHTNMLHAHVGMDDSTAPFNEKMHQVLWDDFFVQQRVEQQHASILRLVPIHIKSSPILIVPISSSTSSSSSSQPTSCDDTNIPPRNEEMIRQIVDDTTYDDDTCDYEIYTLEPDHPVFILLIVILLTLVVVGSQFC